MSETIYALASGQGRAGVAVVRVSGPQAMHSLEILTGLKDQDIERRKTIYTVLKDNVSRETIDSGLVVFFEAPHSYTGEDTAEYHIHGSQASIQNLYDVLSHQTNHRMAEPGEFTRRAFENGKMDLTEAEAVADLIDAQTQLQKQQAFQQMGGGLRLLYEGWSETLKKSLAHIEADIEFPDEDDADGVGAKVLPDLQALLNEMQAHIDDNRRGELLRSGVRVAIIGAPNAGKSSLINALAQRDIAIVSDMPGTTRDVLDVQLDLDGCPVIFYDTAGLRPDDIGEDGHDAIELEGMRRAMAIAEEADLKILLFDGLVEEPDPHTLSYLDENAIVAMSKADQDHVFEYPVAPTHVSVKQKDGLADLLSVLKDKVFERLGSSQAPTLTRDRHRFNVEQAIMALERSFDADLPELIAEDVRLSMRFIGRITGRVDVEDLLDVVFRDFCIGK